MIKVNAVGDACPIPVVKTQKALNELNGFGTVETVVDNEIAVQNLMKLGNNRGCAVKSEKLKENRYKVTFTVGDGNDKTAHELPAFEADVAACVPDSRRNVVVVIASDKMGEGSEELGKTLMKGFIYALNQQESLPKTMLFYNGGAALTCEGSPALEDLKSLAAQGVEILTCGTCLNFYGISDMLQVGEVTNMYVIAEKMTQAGLIVKP